MSNQDIFKGKTFLLMHKDVPAVRFHFYKYEMWANVDEVLDKHHAPVNMVGHHKGSDSYLNKFLDHRVIPKDRPNISNIRDYFDSKSSLELSLRSNMVSVSDHYWIKTEDSNLSWKDVNFYDNTFSNDPIFISSLTSMHKNPGNFIPEKGLSPNVSNNGTSPQMWLKNENDIVLYKTGNQPFFQEPFNEVVISDLLDVMNIEHTNYKMGVLANSVVSECSAFTSGQIEFVPAWQLEKPSVKVNHLNGLENYFEFMRNQGISVNSSIRKNVEEMIIIDYLTFNDDRHWGNFGILRDSTTLEFKGVAPIFDNGRTFGYNSLNGNYENQASPYNLSKAFAESNTHDRELSFVTLNHDINFDKIRHEIPQIFEKRFEETKTLFNSIGNEENQTVVDILERKVPNLINTLQKRVNSLEKELIKKNKITSQAIEITIDASNKKTMNKDKGIKK
ncbi:hypothetical protein [Veillonella sp.]|uniref:hypothetical protein n=1 Tax=Veillonella sp. TaxID=1926307 RepID=UPI0025EEB2B0|nr:hypothetical protein [Veillonella sp.]